METFRAAVAAAALEMNIIGQRKEPNATYTEILVSEGSVLRSGDNLQFISNQPSRVRRYPYYTTALAKRGRFSPIRKLINPGFVEGGSKPVVPTRDLWFWLDDIPARNRSMSLPRRSR